jgi:hypothetical protein
LASKLRVLLPLLLAIVFSGCDALTGAAGHYEGFLISGTSAAPSQSSIAGDARKVSERELKLTIRSEPGGTPTELDAKVSLESVALTIASGGAPRSFELKRAGAHCFGDGKNKLCFDGRELRLDLADPAALYVLERSAPEPAPSPEIARAYSIDELVGRARQRSYESEAEFQSVVAAKLTARSAYLNLLPHLNFGSVLDLDGFVATTMIRAIGDLLPFFLPSRWFEAAALKHAANAEFDGYRVVQADSMNIVQGLALGVLRDTEALEAIRLDRVAITEARDEVLAAERSGNAQVGASDDITSVLDSVLLSIESTKQGIVEERSALAYSAGFNSPDAIESVLSVSVPAVQGPIPGARADFESAAVNRSLELLQLDELVVAARRTKAASFFQWLDPAGNDQGSIGFGLVDYVKVNSATIRQLQDRKAGTQAQLLGTLDDALSASAEIAAQYSIATQAAGTAQARIDRLLLNMRSGIPFAMASLVSAFQDKAASDVQVINARYAFAILQAQVDFLTFSGPYADLLTEKR